VSNAEMDWINQARNGNSEAFSQLVEAYQTPVYNLCYRMMGDSGEAEDAAQETFFRAYQSLKRYDQQRPFITWLLSIAAHYCIDQHRRRRLPALPLDALPEETIPDNVPTPERESVTREANQRVRDMLKSLGPQDRAAVVLRYWYDFSEEEIASALSLTVSAVKSRLHRSRRELAQIWMERQPANSETSRSFPDRRHYESPAF